MKCGEYEKKSREICAEAFWDCQVQEAVITSEDERRASGNGAGPSHSVHSTPVADTPKAAWFQGCRVQVAAM